MVRKRYPACRDLLPWYAVIVRRCTSQLVRLRSRVHVEPLTMLIHRIPPPINRNPPVLGELQREEDRHQRDHRPAVQRRARHIVELAPPCEIPLPDKVLEQRANRKPRAVVDPCGRRDARHAVEDHRRADVFDPAVRVSPLPEPKRQREECADDQRVRVRVVERASSKLPRRPDETPESTR